MSDKKTPRQPGNTYDDGNIPEIDLPGKSDNPSGKSHYGDEPVGDPDSNTNPTGEDHLVWVTPPVLLAEAENAALNTAGTI